MYIPMRRSKRRAKSCLLLTVAPEERVVDGVGDLVTEAEMRLKVLG